MTSTVKIQSTFRSWIIHPELRVLFKRKTLRNPKPTQISNPLNNWTSQKFVWNVRFRQWRSKITLIDGLINSVNVFFSCDCAQDGSYIYVHYGRGISSLTSSLNWIQVHSLSHLTYSTAPNGEVIRRSNDEDVISFQIPILKMDWKRRTRKRVLTNR